MKRVLARDKNKKQLQHFIFLLELLSNYLLPLLLPAGRLASSNDDNRAVAKLLNYGYHSLTVQGADDTSALTMHHFSTVLYLVLQNATGIFIENGKRYTYNQNPLHRKIKSKMNYLNEISSRYLNNKQIHSARHCF
jgi:hypothetical protein